MDPTKIRDGKREPSGRQTDTLKPSIWPIDGRKDKWGDWRDEECENKKKGKRHLRVRRRKLPPLVVIYIFIYIFIYGFSVKGLLDATRTSTDFWLAQFSLHLVVENSKVSRN